MVKLDPFEERLKKISEDKSDLVNKVWSFKTIGEVGSCVHPITGRVQSERVLWMKNHLWPGMN